MNATFTITAADVIDCFRFTVPAGQGVSLATTRPGGGDCSTSQDTTIEVFVDGTLVALDDDDGPGACSLLADDIDLVTDEETTFVACFEGFGTDDLFTWNMSITAAPLAALPVSSPCSPANFTEVCDTAPTQYGGDALLDSLTCTAVTSGSLASEVTSGSSSTPGCVDFTLAQDALVVINATNEECVISAATNNPFIELQTGAGAFITTDNDSGVGTCSRITRSLTAGDYSVCLEDNSFGLTATATISVETAANLCTPVIAVAAGDECSRDDTLLACDGDTECLLTDVDTFTCATAAEPAAEGGDCLEGANSAFTCAAGLACADSVCSNPRVAACEVNATEFTENVAGANFTGAANVISPSCSSGRVERTFTYTVTGQAVNLRASAFGTGTGTVAVAVFRDCVGGVQAACTNNFTTDATATVNDLRAGDTVTILVEASTATGTFDLTVTETARALIGEGESCIPTSTTQSCFDADIPELACVGGPVAATNPFFCAVPTQLQLGDTCTAGNSAEVCGEGLACSTTVSGQQGTCAPFTTVVVEATLTTDNTDWVRPGATCTAGSNTVPFQEFELVNTSGNAVSITVTQSGLGGPTADVCPTDMFIHAYSSRVNPASVLTGCVIGSDDDGPGTCGRFTITIPAGETRFIVASLFSNFGTLPSTYRMNFAGAGEFTANAL